MRGRTSMKDRDLGTIADATTSQVFSDGVQSHRASKCRWTISRIYPGFEACLVNGAAHYRAAHEEAPTPAEASFDNEPQPTVLSKPTPAEPQTDSADEYEGWLLDGIRATPAEALDVERLAATEWAYDTMPESFDVVRDPVKVWNDRLYPATDHDKDRYRRRAAAIVARLSQHTIESQ